MADNYTQSSSIVDIPDDAINEVGIAFAMCCLFQSSDGSEGDAYWLLTEHMEALPAKDDGRVSITRNELVDHLIKNIPTETAGRCPPDRVREIAGSLVDELATWEVDYIEDPGFRWELEDQDRNELWVYGEENINIDSAVCWIQLLATVVPKIQQTAPWYLLWSETCSRPITDQFCGGAVVFTATEETWMNTFRWVEAEIERRKNLNVAISDNLLTALV